MKTKEKMKTRQESNPTTVWALSRRPRYKDMTKEKGITLVALIITIIVLIILAAVTIFAFTETGLLKTATEGTENYANAQEYEQEVMDNLDKHANKVIANIIGVNGGSGEETNPEEPVTPQADGSWNGKVNTPQLMGEMKAVKFNSNGTVTETTDYGNWYNYENNEWANAITKDANGNITGYFVWIPRYEYKITEQVIDVKFIPTSQVTADEGYLIHPSFQDESEDSTTSNVEYPYGNGGWDKELSGYWVAKFPAGYQANEITDNNGTLSTTISNSSSTVVYSNKNYTSQYGSYTTNPLGQTLTASGYSSQKISYPVFMPLTYAYNVISIGDRYTISQEIAKASNFYGLNSSKTDSHMMKNSEWGSVAYLTQSKYGRNGEEPNINNYYTSTESPYKTAITGVYANGTDTAVTTEITAEKAWYTEIGQKGSSTGNMTGVYDLNGCVWESTAGYITNGNVNLAKYGSSFAVITANAEGYKTLSTKYATVYPYNSSSDNNSSNWTMYQNSKKVGYGYGDAVLETSTGGSGYTSWNSDSSSFAYATSPFFMRGGSFTLGSRVGFFAFSTTAGQPYYYCGFLIVLAEV